MSRHRQPLRGATVAALLLSTLAVLLVFGQRPAYSNDIDLLRFNTAKPYVFFILDTSASMTMSPAGQFVHANGDDPRSKLYQAKRVLYDVLKDVDDIQFGFASMNQDKSAIVNKHWLYYSKTALPGSWPISYPRPDADGPVQILADGTVVDDVEGDLMTFGPSFVTPGIAGTCTAPLNLSTEIEKINRFSKLGTYGTEQTQIWLVSGGKTYRLTVDRPGSKPDSSPNSKLGVNGMNVKLTLERVKNNSCTGAQTATFDQTNNLNLDLELWTDFVMADEARGATASGSTSTGVDNVPGYWDYKDIRDTASCGSGHPFSGKGWEGNYDGASVPPVPGTVAGSIKSTEDPYCNPTSPSNCYNLKRSTTFSSFGRPLDSGDMIPLHWSSDNKDLFLDRLAPGQSSGNSPDFRIATFFKDPNAASISPAGVLEPKSSSDIPLFGSGPTPLGKAVIDFRCWYLGEGNKCNESAYNPGWETIAQQNDSAWGCRRPYLIVISDGDDSCPGENPCADTANLNSKGAVRTWVVAFGANCKSAGNPLKCMAQNGKGELLCPATASDLKTELQKILGLIREETRAFASAAVPSVQAIVDDKIFLTNFTPINNKSTWDGHVHSFLKPLPLNPLDKKPDVTHPNHVWDAGEVLKTQVNSSDPLGSNPNQRRVYYSKVSTTGNLASSRRLLEPTTAGVTLDAVRRDLWDGFGLTYTTGNTASEAAAETKANSLIATTFALKSATITSSTGPKTLQYILGDVFHSNPLVIGSPPNSLYFSANIDGYRAFFLKHELRRKLLLVGSNDGMLHAFDAGTYSSTTKKFTNGTGKEVFAYMPRAVMPAVRSMAESTSHQWGVDGTTTVADVRIDPKHDGTPTATERQWRTVAIGGLREGGSGYYALDVTQPDTLSTVGGVANVPTAVNGFIPSCLGGDNGVVSEADCGPVPFPAALWEFNDSIRSLSTGKYVHLDEEDFNNDGVPEGNGRPDLGDTWSVPNIGRIRITESGKTVDKYVAIFGGGLDPDNKSSPVRGTFLYMVDIETGQTLYKRRLSGAVPSEPAAVDTNQDGYVDRIYIGTTAGQMYRVDLKPNSSNVYPATTNKLVRAEDGLFYAVQRIPETVWVPKIIFNANTDAGTPITVSRPIFFRPSVIFVPKLGRYALSFGVGDRDDLWSKDNQAGRFYVFVDDTDDLAAGTVLNESNFNRITELSATVTSQYLFNNSVGRRGWYMVLQTNEKVVTDAFALSGVTSFSSFVPSVEVTGGKDPLCSKTGISRVFVVNTVNANPFMKDLNNQWIREKEVPTLVTNPFTEQGQTKNDPKAAEICDEPTMMTLMNTLKALYPQNCKFTNYRVDIKTIAADTGLVCIAPVPICIIEKNWKEF
jgi:Tfp pilus tip-associated adhesin PilY1